MRGKPEIGLGLLKSGKEGQRLGGPSRNTSELVGTIANREHVEIEPPKSGRSHKSVCIQWHSFSVRGLSRPKSGTIWGKAPPQPKKGLATTSFFGEYRSCNTHDISRLAGTPARPSRSGFVFVGFFRSTLLM